MKYIYFYSLCVYAMALSAQSQLHGIVLERINNQDTPIYGANVYWLNTTIGTTTERDGAFSIDYDTSRTKLIISYVGYKTDTISVSSNSSITHTLKSSEDLDAVTITSRQQTTTKSYLKAANTFTVSSEELLKAACCNLSESFETNPSIDVNFTDAVTGTRQIKMLGLDSPYILIATENIPAIRGASQTYGLSFIPGTWVESIQITKGAGSVINGFESIAGQINAELVKPLTDNRFFANLYAASNERIELNTHLNTKLSERWSTGVYLHGNSQQQKHDVNHDDFLDMPLYNQVNVMNRWQYTDTQNGFLSFINLRYLYDEKQAGELNFNPDTDKGTTNAWGSEIDTERFDISAKFGYVNPQVPYQSLGIQTAFSYHKQESYFGLNTYNIKHNSLYSNLIYNSIISDSRHKIKTGISVTLDDYDEVVNTEQYNRIENAIGAFFEYAYDDLDKLTLTAGVRADQHNRFGFFITPRLHVRYSPWDRAALRGSIGRGIRSANIFAETQQMFASARQINIQQAGGSIYGLDPEIAWNFGVSYLQGFNLFGRKADITVDMYRTDFENQVVTDWENPFEIAFYNLEGASFANSLQVELNYSPFERFNIRTAYKYYDIQTDYTSGRQQNPLIPQHRFFANVAYNTPSTPSATQWKVDATFNWLSEQRFPDTTLSPSAFQRPEQSPTVATLNAQITRVFSSQFEVYVGGENITNFKQPNPIISPDNPFGSNFDATFVYGPIFGSVYYVGLRYKI